MNPPLRFSTSEDWTECQLKDICEINPSVEKIPDTFQYIDLESVTNGRLLQTIPCCKSSAPSRAKRILSNEDVLFQTVRPYQKNNYFFKSDSNTSVVASTGYAQLRCTSNSAYFLYTLIHTDSFVNQVLQKCTGGAYPAITASSLSTVKINIPVVQEQQKIASFFSTLDQKIELNERKLEALEELKKGLMQKIFNREIRFKQEDGSDFPKWNNKRLGEVACLNNGRAYKQEELLNEGKYIVLRVGNFFTNEKYYYSNMELESCKYAHKGDLLYCWSASFGPKIWGGEKVIYHYHIWKIDPINIDKNYLYYYLQRDVENLKQEMNGGTMMHLTKSNMERRSIEIPVIEEQTKIASLFIHFDKKIELVLAKINSLKNLKQGFMQQMFV